MGFDKHLFISYAHIDNEPLPPAGEGWSTRFHASIETFLSMRLGEKARIWQDKQLTGDEVCAQEIVDQFPHIALLVSVLTPRYLNSQWCTKDIQEFCNSAQHSWGVVVENQARIFR